MRQCPEGRQKCRKRLIIARRPTTTGYYAECKECSHCGQVQPKPKPKLLDEPQGDFSLSEYEMRRQFGAIVMPDSQLTPGEVAQADAERLARQRYYRQCLERAE